MDILIESQYKIKPFVSQYTSNWNTQHKHMTGFTFVLNEQQENFGGKNDFADAGTTDDVM